MINKIYILFLGLLVISFSSPIENNWKLETKLTVSEEGFNDGFGMSVAVSGKFAVISAYDDQTDSIEDAGLAYVYCNNNGKWEFYQKIRPKNQETNDQFGNELAICGNYIVVTAKFNTKDSNGDNPMSYAGAAYIFHNNNGIWEEIQKITASDRRYEEWFGESVAIKNNYIAISSRNWKISKKGYRDDFGAVYVFYNNQGVWEEIQKIEAQDKELGDDFGCSIDMSGDYMIIGAQFDNKNKETGYKDSLSENEGAAYIFYNYDGIWTEVQKIRAADRKANATFGASVAISDKYVVVGACTENLTEAKNSNWEGAVYIFEKREGLWQQTQIIETSDFTPEDFFGNELSLSDDLLVVGASSRGIHLDIGAAYIYKNYNGKWKETQIIKCPNKTIKTIFGSSIAITDDNILINRYREKNVPGSVYIYKKTNVISRNNQNEIEEITDSKIQKDTFNNLITDTSVLVQKWKEVARFKNSDAVNTEECSEIKLSDNFAVVGSYWIENDNFEDSRLPYIIEKINGEWKIAQRLSLPEKYKDDNIAGINFAVEDDCIVLTSTGEHLDWGFDRDKDWIFTKDPAVYIFKKIKNKWECSSKVIPENKENINHFGKSVALYNDYIFIGADRDDGNNNIPDFDPGEVYVFKTKNGKWQQTQIISSPLNVDKNAFACSIDVSENRLIIGAKDESLYKNGKVKKYGVGSAYIYELINGKWQLKQKLIPQNYSETSDFGSSVAVYNNYAVIGAETESVSDVNVLQGAAYIFKNKNGTWEQTQKLQPPDFSAVHCFGDPVCMTDKQILVGASPGSLIFGDESVFLYQEINGIWENTQTFLPDDRDAWIRFGSDANMNKQFMIIPEHNRDDSSAILHVYEQYDTLINRRTILSDKQEQKDDIYTDKRDGKEYNLININNQVWMAENIAYKTDNGCFAYNNSKSNSDIYGYLYTYEVAKNICPDGWHLPSDEEWKVLERNHGMVYRVSNWEEDRNQGSYAGGKLKLKSSLWKSPNAGAVNQYSFSALPAGYCIHDGNMYKGIGKKAFFWTSTSFDNNKALTRSLNYDNCDISRYSKNKENVYSVRCIKDKSKQITIKEIKPDSSNNVINISGDINYEKTKHPKLVITEKNKITEYNDSQIKVTYLDSIVAESNGLVNISTEDLHIKKFKKKKAKLLITDNSDNTTEINQYSLKKNQLKLDLSNYKNGIYTIKFKYGNKQFSWNIVKQ